jgi:peptide/nickel transport system permease protein
MSVRPPSSFPRYLLARLAQAAGVLVVAYVASYLILWALPGDALASVTGGQATDLTEEQLAAIRSEWGLDQPLIVRLVTSGLHALTGDLGRSFVSGRPVSQLILESLPATLQIATLGFALAVIFGTGIALLATRVRFRWLSGLLLSLPPLGVAIPSFWLGLLLIQFFSFQIHLFPATGNLGIQSAILPAITLAVPTSALIAQLLAQGLQRELAQPYSDTARAKGASATRVQLRHAFRNAALPAMTIAGLVVGNLLSGSVVTETVFGRTGLGRLTADSVSAQDIPVVQGVVVFAALVFVLVNLIVDLVYPLLDPRIVTGGLRRRSTTPRSVTA